MVTYMCEGSLAEDLKIAPVEKAQQKTGKQQRVREVFGENVFTAAAAGISAKPCQLPLLPFAGISVRSPAGKHRPPPTSLRYSDILRQFKRLIFPSQETE